MNSHSQPLTQQGHAIDVNNWPSDRLDTTLNLIALSEAELIKELIFERDQFYQLEALVTSDKNPCQKAHPSKWPSELKGKPLNLYSLSKSELIRELIFERMEYLSFELELSKTYGFKQRQFPT